MTKATEIKKEESQITREEQLRARRGEALVLPSLSIKDIKEGDSLFIRIDSLIETKPQTDKEGNNKMEDGKLLEIHTAKITDMLTGERGSMVIPFMVMKALKGIEYLNKEFELVKGRKVNRTNEWSTYILS